MKNIITVIKKELKRFFTDKRMLISLILPGVLIFFLYSFMGDINKSNDEFDKDYKFSVSVIRKPLEFKENIYFKNLDILINEKTLDILEEEVKEKIKNKEYDLLVIFDEDFYDKMNNYVIGEEKAPSVSIYYNSTRKESNYIYQLYKEVLNTYEASISNKFDINDGENYNLATKEGAFIEVITMLIPFLLITFLYSGAMSISIESIAGEKERGTIATLLATPVKRSAIAIGKVVSLSIVSLVSAASSFIGLMLSLPKLMGNSDINVADVYGFGTYALLFIVLVTTSLVFVVLVSIISTYAKTVKEASGLSVVLMVINMLLGVTSLNGVVASNRALYLIPIYNSVQSVSSILSLNFNYINFLLTIVSNFLIVGIGIYLITKMFDSEKIMFNK